MIGRKVVVTGLGTVCPVGVDVESSWKSILAGNSGIRKIDYFDVQDFSVQIAGMIPADFSADPWISPKEQRRTDRFIHYGVAAGVQALQDSKLEVTEANAHRIGTIIGSGIGGLPCIESNYAAWSKGGPRKISPFLIPASISNMIAGNLSIQCGFKGPNFAIVSACATGTHSIGESARKIALGDADVIIAGGAEMTTSVLGLGGFASARALSSSHNDDPQRASRPWDMDRDGFVLGEGAGVLVLEEYEHAKSRGANIYCELAGYGASSDAHHITQPSPGGEGAARCMHSTLKDAQLNPDDVDYINAHGTSTPLGDLAETQAIKSVFGDYAQQLPTSSVKSMIGHLLGAAGGVEAVFSVLSIRDQALPPTINMETPDPQCDLDYVPNEARQAKVNCVLSNSFGFGGTNASLLFRSLQ